MNKFINLRNGRINVTSYRVADHKATTLEDLIACAITGSDDYLTADFSADALCKHPKACEFLTQHGVKCGSRLVLDWDAFVILSDNTVVVDIA